MDDRLAATHLCHLAALAVHRAAAGALCVAHREGSHAGHHWCGRGQQKQYRDEAEETAHDYLNYRVLQNLRSGKFLRFGFEIPVVFAAQESCGQELFDLCRGELVRPGNAGGRIRARAGAIEFGVEGGLLPV
jgi:hypothetical protein